MEFNISTTGINVTLDDLGVTLTHPQTLDLIADGLGMTDIIDSVDLEAALELGTLIANDGNGLSISINNIGSLLGRVDVIEPELANKVNVGDNISELVNDSNYITAASAGVQSVVAGTNVTIDNTDPQNPIVSSAGNSGGGGRTTVWAEENNSFNSGTNGGFQFSFGNGATSNNGLTMGYACSAINLTWSSNTAPTGVTVELYLNDVGTGQVATVTGTSGVFNFPTPVAIVEADRIMFRTLTGSGGSKVVIGVTLETEGVKGEKGDQGEQGIPGSSTGGDFSNNGDTVGANRTLGNIDAFELGFITNNTPRITIQSDGDIGFGIGSPLARFHAEGSDPAQEVFLVRGAAAQSFPFFQVRESDNNVLFQVGADGTVDVGNNNIVNVIDPVNDQDAATKIYVDEKTGFFYRTGTVTNTNPNTTAGNAMTWTSALDDQTSSFVAATGSQYVLQEGSYFVRCLVRLGTYQNAGDSFTNFRWRSIEAGVFGSQSIVYSNAATNAFTQQPECTGFITVPTGTTRTIEVFLEQSNVGTFTWSEQRSFVVIQKVQ